MNQQKRHPSIRAAQRLLGERLDPAHTKSGPRYVDLRSRSLRDDKFNREVATPGGEGTIRIV